MSKHNKLEMYLIKLEKSLGSIPISEKAEIITEIKSHILDATENNSGASIDDILKSLGEPEQVANKYLLERGLSPQKPPKHPIVKWLVIGFLGTFAISAAMTLVLLFKFSPLIEVDEKAGTVKILGGMIDVQESKGNISMSGLSFGSMNMNLNKSFSGNFDLSGKIIEELMVDLDNTKLIVENTDANSVEYDCSASSHSDESPSAVLKVDGKVLKFMVSQSKNTKCELGVPKKMSLNVNAKNGKFIFEELANNVNVNALNGKIVFSPDEKLKYNYKLNVTNGKISDFTGSEDNDAFKVELKLINGKITN